MAKKTSRTVFATVALLASSLVAAPVASASTAVIHPVVSSTPVSSTPVSSTPVSSTPVSSTPVSSTSQASSDNTYASRGLASSVGKQIINWAKKQGGKVFEGLKNSVKKGKNALVHWFKNTLPKALYDMAVQAGLQAVIEWIINNWPF